MHLLAMRNQTTHGRRLKVQHDGVGGILGKYQDDTDVLVDSHPFSFSSGTILVDLTDNAHVPLTGQRKKALANAIATIPGLCPPLDIAFQKMGPIKNPGS